MAGRLFSMWTNTGGASETVSANTTPVPGTRFTISPGKIHAFSFEPPTPKNLTVNLKARYCPAATQSARQALFKVSRRLKWNKNMQSPLISCSPVLSSESQRKQHCAVPSDPNLLWFCRQAAEAEDNQGPCTGYSSVKHRIGKDFKDVDGARACPG